MSKICSFYQSTIGKKFVVAVTGVALFLFVLGHMAGNLKAFMGVGPDGVHALDHYAEFLREIGADMLGQGTFLWLARGGLLLCLLLHVATIIQLRLRNRAAGGGKYAVPSKRGGSYSAYSMFLGGLIILVFIIFHLLHFTTGHLHFHGFEYGKVFQNVSNAFQHGGIVFIYLVGMLALGLHLYHGLWSLFQTLGLDNPDRNASLRGFAKGATVVIVIGFLSVPLSIFSGLLG